MGHHATVINADTPTMTYPGDTKEEYYDCLSWTIAAVPSTDKLLLLSDFNAQVGHDSFAWDRVWVIVVEGRKTSIGRFSRV